MNRGKIIFCVAILFGFALGVLLRQAHPNGAANALESELEEARKRAEDAVLIRSVSRQMEEIAYQQKELSDRQRRRAELQAQENYRMKLRVEEEWKRAVTAQEEAEKAYEMAESQRRLAEERRLQAEMSKRKADTLTYLTLGRSLGTTAATLFRTGNPETATLLAYASWTFVKRYGGDRFTPSVYNAMTLVSGQPYVWKYHRGGIGAVVWKNTGAFYSVGRYGEVMEWTVGTGGKHGTRTLMSDPQRDFRDAYLADNGLLYALSYGGEILAFSDDKEEQCRTLGKRKCVSLLPMGGDLWTLTSDGWLQSTDEIRFLPVEGLTCVTAFGNRLFAGTANGDLMEIHGNAWYNRTTCNLHPATVTAIAHDRVSGITAWGYDDGTVMLTDRKGKRLKRLVGHRSAVTGLAFTGNMLCSCSHDRTLRLWNLLEERTESVIALEAGSWLLCMALSPDGKTLLAGDAEGSIYCLSVFPDDMAGVLRKSLRRELTHREWEYYIGKGVPYETYINKKH